MERPELTPICATLDGHTIRCVQLKLVDDGWQAQAYGYTPYLHTTEVDKLNLQQQLVGLREILATPQWGEFVGNQLIVNLPSLFADEKIQNVAFKDANKVDDVLRSAAQRATDTDAPTYFQHHELYQFMGEGGDMQTVYLLHFQPAMLHHHLNDLLQDLELETRVESSTAALAKLVSSKADSTELIAHVGVLSTKLMIWNNHLVEVISVPVGFEHFLKEATNTKAVSRSEAYKVLTGKTISNDPISETAGVSLDQLAGAMTKVTSIADVSPQKIVVTGDGARIAGLDKHLFESTGVSTTNFDPWQAIDTYPLRPLPRSLKPTFASALSLALN